MFSLKDPSAVYAGVIEVYENVISNSKELIELSEKINNWQNAKITNGEVYSEIVDKKIRSNEILFLDQFSYSIEPEFYEMCKVVWQYCNNYAIKYNVPFYSTENAQILKYSPGEYYDPHCDYGPNLPRVFSALLYLNDVEEGGETEFINFDIKIKPKAGTLVIFPSNYAYAHAARPPKDGNKYVTVFWMRG